MVLNKYDIDFQQIAAIHNDSYTNATGIKRSNNGLLTPCKILESNRSNISAPSQVQPNPSNPQQPRYCYLRPLSDHGTYRSPVKENSSKP